jgi:MFS family permease
MGKTQDMKSRSTSSWRSYFAKAAAVRNLPTGIWALGLVSMFMDTSSELVHSLLPVFMANILGASMTAIGVIEGVAEATAAVTKVFSGTISDYFGKRKLLAVLGYGLAAFTKPIFPLAKTLGWVFTARFIDRIGKGIRGTPRDALVACITPREQLGAAYGLRQSLDSIGAFIGPLLAMVFVAWMAFDIREVLWFAVVPAFVAVVILVFGVREPEPRKDKSGARMSFTLTDIKRLPLNYWLVVLLGGLFTLARFSEAFLVLRGKEVGLAIGYVPLVLVVMNIFYALSSYPVGAVADVLGHRTLLMAGLVVLIAADIFLAKAASFLPFFAGAALWGLHMGFTQGLFSKLVADTAPADFLGTAFGIFNLIVGGALLLASVIAGALWSAFGAPATFMSGAAFSTFTLLGLTIYRKRPENPVIGDILNF